MLVLFCNIFSIRFFPFLIRIYLEEEGAKALH